MSEKSTEEVVTEWATQNQWSIGSPRRKAIHLLGPSESPIVGNLSILDNRAMLRLSDDEACDYRIFVVEFQNRLGELLAMLSSFKDLTSGSIDPFMSSVAGRFSQAYDITSGTYIKVKSDSDTALTPLDSLRLIESIVSKSPFHL